LPAIMDHPSASPQGDDSLGPFLHGRSISRLCNLEILNAG
jgi:hypothetical protein